MARDAIARDAELGVSIDGVGARKRRREGLGEVVASVQLVDATALRTKIRRGADGAQWRGKRESGGPFLEGLSGGWACDWEGHSELG